MRPEQTRDRQRRRTRANRSRTISIGSADRGQTTQDFAVGIGVFLLAIAFVFSFLPTVATPHDSSISGAERAQADRIADRILYSATTETPNEIDATEFEDTYASASEDELIERLGLRSSGGNAIDRVHITVEGLDTNATIGSTTDWTAGEEHGDRPVASSVRIVTVANGPESCTPACRLIVRVW